MTGPRIAILDIETSPNLALVWGLFNQNVSLGQLLEVCEVISFASKWHGEKRTEFHSVYDFEAEKITLDAKTEMVARAHEILTEADLIVHFNGTSFDIPHLHRELLLMEYPPPAPHKDVDLLTVARRRFRFTSNKLAHVAEQLGVQSKGDPGGFETWRACMEGEPAAWRRMRLYNRRDVSVTEQVYERMLPWIPNHPPVHLYGADPETDVCGRCGGELRKHGFHYTALGKYQAYQCKTETCRSWSRGKRRLDAIDARPAS